MEETNNSVDIYCFEKDWLDVSSFMCRKGFKLMWVHKLPWLVQYNIGLEIWSEYDMFMTFPSKFDPDDLEKWAKINWYIT